MSADQPADMLDGDRDGARNVVVGDVDGVLVQARVIEGDVTIKVPERKAVVPRQLPVAVRDFIGRQAELDALTAMLDEAAVTGMVVVSAVEGSAGIGKTTLAIYWAHRARDRFPDGQLYANLFGFDPAGEPLDPAVVVRGFLDAFEVPPSRIPANLDAQAALYRSLVAGRRMLVVLDNCRDSGQVRPLLPGGTSCMVIVTSRSRLDGLVAREGARRLVLGLLTLEEARALLAARIGEERVAAEPEETDALIELCARLPLALSIAAARAAANAPVTLAGLVAELRDRRARLEEFDLGEVEVNLQAVFSWSYLALTPEASRLFRLIGLHPGPDIGAPAAAALGGASLRETRALLKQLVNAHLLEELEPGRYQFHDLLRAYARDRVSAEESRPDSERAVARMLDFYLHSAVAADRQLYPHREPIVLSPHDERVDPRQFRDYDEAMAWLTTEYPCLLAAADHAAEEELDRYTWQLSWSLATFMDRQVHWHDWIAITEKAIVAARRLNDRAGEARLRYNLGHAYAQRERNAEAYDQIEQALAVFQELGDQVCEAHAFHSMSWMLARQGRYAEGLVKGRQALEIHQTCRNRFGEAEALNTVGWLHGLVGDHEQNLTCCKAALTVLEGLGQRHSVAFTLDHIGDAYRNLGKAAEAMKYHRGAVELFHEVGMAFEEATAVAHLGDAAFAADDHAAALAAWQRGRTIFVQLERSEATTLAEKISAIQGTDS
ncbi:tetratricopeptide repeat protein [Amycolatopsis sp. NPDC049868]|uniref:tetratricopeptide repeat protein n=1 Tax=Amycolatopsis sp. NPDC049868 TaxID=3363934 RepID=UPI0037926624